MLTDFKTSTRPILRKQHQVLDFLIVDLHYRKANLEGLGGAFKLLNAVEDLIASDGNDAFVCAITDLNSYSHFLTMEYDLPDPVWP